MVRCSPNLPHTHKLTKFSDDVAFKVGPSVTQDLGQCYKDQDINLPQEPSNSFHSLIGGHIHHDMLSKMVAKDQMVHQFWGLIQLHCCLDVGKVILQQLQRCGNNDWSHWGFGTNAFMLDESIRAANHPLHLGWVIRTNHSASTVSAVGLGVWHRTDIHSWQLPGSLGDHELQNFLQFACRVWWWVKKIPGRALTSSSLTLFSICTHLHKLLDDIHH